MSRFRLVVLGGFFALALSACGGGDSTPQPGLRGGAIQGRPLSFTPAVSTFAGSATNGSADGVGAAAAFWNPAGITTDGTHLYVADGANFTVRKVGIAFGNVTTLAGKAGISGSANGKGPGARFSTLSGITTDGANLFVADAGNNTIRKVGIAFGNVTTLAGAPGTIGFQDGKGPAASFSNPQGITTDGGNLYVADSGNNTIRKIVIATGEVTTLAGSPTTAGFVDGTGTSANFSNPQGITTDNVFLYVTDSGNGTIRKIAIGTGVVTTLAGSAGVPGFADGTGAFARFSGPFAITTDGKYLYVTDNASLVRKVTIFAGTASSTVIGPNGSPIVTTVPVAAGTVTTLAGKPGSFGLIDGTGDSISLSTGVPVLTFGDARFWFPQGLTTDGKYLYVSDTVNNVIRKMY